MDADLGEHWDAVYGSKAPAEVSWYQADPTVSLRLVERYAPAGGAVVDVGAGASPLADLLLERGGHDVTLVDVSGEALATVGRRLGARASAVDMVVGDVTRWEPARSYGVWHDRAVFHFLVDAEARQRYVRLAAAAVAPSGVAIVATFAGDGPTQCSGLPTVRYDAGALAATFGAAFALEHSEREEHVTPWGAVQPFTWVVLRRAATTGRP